MCFCLLKFCRYSNFVVFAYFSWINDYFKTKDSKQCSPIPMNIHIMEKLASILKMSLVVELHHTDMLNLHSKLQYINGLFSGSSLLRNKQNNENMALISKKNHWSYVSGPTIPYIKYGLPHKTTNWDQKKTTKKKGTNKLKFCQWDRGDSHHTVHFLQYPCPLWI